MPITAGPVAQLLRSLTVFLRPAMPRPAQVLVVVEGSNDIEFLRRISSILHRDDPSLPDLADMERRLALVIAPTGGVDLSTGFRFAGLSLPEFHLLDRDIPPATQNRQHVAAMVAGPTSAIGSVIDPAVPRSSYWTPSLRQ
jgi:hypothetical protein